MLLRRTSEPRTGSLTTTTELFQWLDEQPKEPVIYVSYGSGGTLSYEQMTGVAMGLILSEQRFVWVIRVPISKSSDSAFFTRIHGSDDPKSHLPEGFLIRTSQVGQVVGGGAQQVDILSHPSTGRFLSHCGWSSTLVSLINGAPMVAWPLYAEQRMNASFLAEELGVAVHPKVLPAKKMVWREEIAKMVKKILVENEGRREGKTNSKDCSKSHRKHDARNTQTIFRFQQMVPSQS